jgi:hypothetical protein
MTNGSTAKAIQLDLSQVVAAGGTVNVSQRAVALHGMHT